jgi:hypothetical protein
MIYTISSMIYRHQYDFGRKKIVNGKIYGEINMIYTISSKINRYQYDFSTKKFRVNGMIMEKSI